MINTEKRLNLFNGDCLEIAKARVNQYENQTRLF